jgi:hypothetical protein
MSRIIVTVFAVLVLGNAAAAQPVRFLGAPGGMQCTRWLEIRYNKYNSDTNDAIYVFALEAWVLGYMSGIAFDVVNATAGVPENVSNFLYEITENEVLTRVDNYCRGHSSDLVVQAVGWVSTDLMQVQADRIRKAVKGAPH